MRNGCHLKRGYDDKNTATRTALRFMRSEQRDFAAVYDCEFCPKFHITHDPSARTWDRVVILLEAEG